MEARIPKSFVTPILYNGMTQRDAIATQKYSRYFSLVKNRTVAGTPIPTRRKRRYDAHEKHGPSSIVQGNVHMNPCGTEPEPATR
ncbi:hypothetical protein LMG27952_00282 [Paraburkholderia hiiakae]|uniref:Uncharacterized protein n=1 Tax=Paraburkholderia hiiakae TaxID=1081782 RepID=A0ABN7HGL7_9BURK|nr:hypothetical protein LMG27952_00282 [Paraburkholderia hiiakae]